MNSKNSHTLKFCLMAFILITNSMSNTSSNNPKQTRGLLNNNSQNTFGNEEITASCNRELLESLGFEGHDKPRKEALEMCPSVGLSCCKSVDQLNIYSNWIQNNEEKNLKNIISNHQNVYAKLLDLSMEAYKRAKQTADLLKKKQTSNCKVLARRVMHFQIKEIAPKLKDAHVQMEEFLFNSHKSFYCAICDANLNPFINVTKQSVILSEKYCRDITTNTLHVLLYFRAHFTKFLNLVSRFVTSCNVKGVYKENRTIIYPKFHIGKKVYENLINCKKYRNDENWLEFCMPLCNKFNLFRYDNYFAPNIKKFNKYNRFLTKRLQKLKKEQEFVDLVENRSKKARNRRILSLKPSKESHSHNNDISDPNAEELNAKLEEELMFKENPVIIRSTLGASVDLDDFLTITEPKGLDLFKIGKNSQITEAIFTALKTSEISSKEKQNANTSKDGVKDTNEVKHLYILHSVLMLLILAVLFK